MIDQDALFSGHALDRGRNPKRLSNQDNVGVFSPVFEGSGEHLFIVCDGMGGHHAGEIASRIGVEQTWRGYQESRPALTVEESLRAAIRRAHKAIRDYASTSATPGPMGTTAVVAAIAGGQMHVANVGDSRAYLSRQGRIRQITADHSQAAAMAAEGTGDQDLYDRIRHILTRSLNSVRESVEADLFAESFEVGDIMVLCSDGLWAAVPDASIARTVSRLPPQEAAQSLVSQANRAGGQDNISVVVVRRGSIALPPDEGTGELRWNR